MTINITSAELSSLPHSLTSKLLSLCKYSLPNIKPGSDQPLTFRGNKRQGVVRSLHSAESDGCICVGGPERSFSIFSTRQEVQVDQIVSVGGGGDRIGQQA